MKQQILRVSDPVTACEARELAAIKSTAGAIIDVFDAGAAIFSCASCSKRASRRLSRWSCAPQLLASRIPPHVMRQTIARSPALRGNTRDASHPRSISQARMHPPPIDVGIVTSGSARVAAEDLEHRGPGCCVVYRGCNALPRISELSAEAGRISGINQSRHSRRSVPITRSQIAFAFGQRCGDPDDPRYAHRR
ncbi:MAG: hypothetical protein JWN13_4509 [Betaproteobacteria bacterium]|nr:hypothetical protein [Betaproteobacteria bacterium]